MNKFKTFVRVGFKCVSAMAAVYVAYKIMEDKTSELVQNGGMGNAVVVGLGEGAILTTVGTAVLYVM